MKYMQEATQKQTHTYTELHTRAHAHILAHNVVVQAESRALVLEKEGEIRGSGDAASER